MVAPEGREYAPYLTLKAAEALVRSLVGVAGVSVKSDVDGALCEIVIIPEPGTSDRSVGRDVRSALKARFGLSIDPGTITIATPEADTEKQRPLDSVDPAWPGSSVSPQVRDGNGIPVGPNRNGDVPGASESAVKRHDPEPLAGPKPGSTQARDRQSAAAPESEAAARMDVPAEPAHTRVGDSLSGPQLERVEMETLERGLRCRITIAAGDERFQGVAEAATGFTAEAELAARTTLDAMRSARMPREPVQLQGVSLIDLAGRPHVVVSLAVWKGDAFEPLAGAEPVGDSVAEAAARSVFGSLKVHMPGPASQGA